MLPYLVVKSQFGKMGRGVNGHTLYNFLRCYVGKQRVAVCDAAALSQAGEVSADIVFLGLPTKMAPEQLRQIRCRQLILFDLFDVNRPLWDDTNRDHLLEHADMYLKAWRDDRWDFGIPVGVAPIRRYHKLRVQVKLTRVLQCLHQPSRCFDVAFLGAPTCVAPDESTEEPAYHQRVEWLLEVVRQRPDYRFWGGLFEDTKFTTAWRIDLRQEIEKKYGNVDDLFVDRKVNFNRYFAALARSKVLLTPRGWAPWSYRQYEAIYAGATVVTTDFQHVDTLIPLPQENMVHVPDHESVLPAIEKALRLHDEQPEMAAESIRLLERYLNCGVYSRKRPALLERFLGQLPGASTRQRRAA